MPLTISHPAASVPFARLGLVLSALIIGSMTPDLPYFIPIFPQSGFSHSIIGLFIFCLPLGLILLGIFHFLLKFPALSLLPINHQGRLYGVAGGFSFCPSSQFLKTNLSILVGAFTHILWDSFTHPKGWMVQQFAVLKSSIFTIGSYSLPIYEFLQHGGTFFGGVLLFYWYIIWYRRAKSFVVPAKLVIADSTKLIIFTTLSFIALAIALFSGFVSIPVLQTSLYYRLFIGHVFIVGVTAFISELLLFSIFWYFALKKGKVE